MRITFTCPSGHKLRARPEKAGTKAICPACGVQVEVPRLTGEVDRAGSQPRAAVKRPPAAPSAASAAGPAKFPPRVEATRNEVAPPPLPSAAPTTIPPPLPNSSVQSASAPPIAPAAALAPDEAVVPTSPSLPGYQPDRYKLASVYWLGLALLAITVVEMIPAISHSVYSSAPFFTISGAPAWAQAVLVLCLLQLVYVAWMVSLPDWSTVWTLMLIYGLVAALYGYALAVSLMTPRDQELMLGLDAVRRLTPLWCSAMILLTFLAAFLCGRTSTRWHRAYLALVKARGLRW